MLDFVDGITDFDTVFELDNSFEDFPLQTSSEDTTEGSESFDSKSSREVKVKSKKRKRSARQSSVLIPRMLVSDIRRSFAFMFVNCLNNSDISMFFEFLVTYSCPNVSFLQEAPGCSSLRYFNLNGVTEICQLFYNKMCALPDSVHRIPDYCRVITRPDGTTEIVAIMNLSATRLFDVGFEYIIPQPTDSPSSEHYVQIVNKTTNKCVGTLDGSINQRLQRLPILAEPIDMLCSVQFTMCLNEHKQIERMSLTLPRNIVLPMKNVV